MNVGLPIQGTRPVRHVCPEVHSGHSDPGGRLGQGGPLDHGGDQDRRGAAVAELALVLPVVFILVFGTLEVCQRMLLRQSATVAAYESARLAARRTVTAARAEERGEALLADRRIVNGRVQVIPGDLSEVQTGHQIRIVVRVPIAGNTSMNYVLPASGEISVDATMLRE